MILKKQLILFGILGLLVLTGCEYMKLPSNSQDSCEEKAKELIPDKLTLTWSIEAGGPWGLKEFNWRDGTRVGNKVVISYGGSSKAGDNVNYYYPNTLSWDTYLDYSKRIVNEKGIILGNNEFEVELILNPLPKTERIVLRDHYFQRQKHQEFEVVEIRFQSCNWVE